jgi:hypothetical protein
MPEVTSRPGARNVRYCINYGSGAENYGECEVNAPLLVSIMRQIEQRYVHWNSNDIISLNTNYISIKLLIMLIRTNNYVL